MKLLAPVPAPKLLPWRFQFVPPLRDDERFLFFVYDPQHWTMGQVWTHEVIGTHIITRIHPTRLGAGPHAVAGQLTQKRPTAFQR